MRHLALPGLLLVASILSAAAGARQTGSPPDARAVWHAIAQAPAEARSWKNPYAGQPEAVQAGEKLFRRHCAECHGLDARGKNGRAADLHSRGVQNAAPGELVWFLRNGNLRKGMPSWSGLPPQRQWQIVTYLETLR